VAATAGAGRSRREWTSRPFPPLWLSIVGRTFTPAQSTLDASAGYELRTHPDRLSERWGYARGQLRLVLGIKEMRFASSPLAPVTSDVTALRAGMDWTLFGPSTRGFNVWRAHLVGLWDPARAEAGAEFETTAGISVSPHVLGGGFLGCAIGYLPSSGAYGWLEVGAAWEVGR
jgi:hypothetical protein